MPRRFLAAVLLLWMTDAAAAQTAASPDRTAAGAVTLPTVSSAGPAPANQTAAPPVNSSAAATPASRGTTSSGAAAAPAAARAGSNAAGLAPGWVLCPPSGAPGLATLFEGTDLSCAP